MRCIEESERSAEERGREKGRKSATDEETERTQCLSVCVLFPPLQRQRLCTSDDFPFLLCLFSLCRILSLRGRKERERERKGFLLLLVLSQLLLFSHRAANTRQSAACAKEHNNSGARGARRTKLGRENKAREHSSIRPVAGVLFLSFFFSPSVAPVCAARRPHCFIVIQDVRLQWPRKGSVQAPWRIHSLPLLRSHLFASQQKDQVP